jgi:hypothetical protein
MGTCLVARLTRLGLACVAGLAAAAGLIHFHPGAAAHSPLDRLDPGHIPAGLRPRDPPRELVGVVGRPGTAQTEQVSSAALSPDGAWVAVGTRGGAVRLLEVPGLRPCSEFAAHDGRVSALAFAPDGRTLASGSADGRVRRWARDGAPLPEADPGRADAGPVLALAFAPDGRTLAAGYRDGVRLWAIDRLRPEPAGELPTPNCPVYALAFSPEGRRLAAGGGGVKAVRLWRLDGTRAEPEILLEGCEHWVRGLAFAPDGGAVAALDSEGRGFVRDAGGPRLAWRVSGPVCLSGQFAADGRHLLTVHLDGTAWILRLPERWSGP